MPETDGARRELTGLVLRGIAWMAASQVALQVLALATSVSLARLLLPREVGLAGEALVFTSLALVLVDSGIAAAVVQKPGLTQDDRSTAFWLSLLLGLGLTVAAVGLSWPISHLYGEPAVQSLFAVMSLNFLFTSAGLVQGALLTRSMAFRGLELRNVVAALLSSAVAVALAAAGAGPWAIVGQSLAISGVSTVLLWRSSPWRPSASFSRASVREMLPYSSQVLGSQTLEWGGTNLDSLLVGRFLGAGALGAYSIAFSVMVTPAARIAHPLTNVFFPAFSRLRDGSRIGAMWLRAMPLLAALVVPAMLGLMAVAPDFVDAIFGPRWHAAAPVILILAPVGLVQALSGLNGGILQAVGRTATLLRFTLLRTIATVGGIAIGLPWGLEGVALGYLVGGLLLEPSYLWLTARALEISPWAWLRAIRGVLEAAVAMFAAVLGARELLLGTGLPVGLRLALLVALGGGVYLPLLLWRVPAVRAEIGALRAR